MTPVCHQSAAGSTWHGRCSLVRYAESNKRHGEPAADPFPSNHGSDGPWRQHLPLPVWLTRWPTGRARSWDARRRVGALVARSGDGRRRGTTLARDLPESPEPPAARRRSSANHGGVNRIDIDNDLRGSRLRPGSVPHGSPDLSPLNHLRLTHSVQNRSAPPTTSPFHRRLTSTSRFSSLRSIS